MQYFGGKGKVCKPLAAYVNSRLAPGQPYWEPFCGGCWVASHVDAGRPRTASDAHPDLVAMWSAIQAGWDPPGEVSLDLYQEVRRQGVSGLRGFVGFGCSFAGKWFGGYARNSIGHNYAGSARNSVLKKMEGMRDVRFVCSDYRSINPEVGTLLYCDPPYANSTGYSLGRFDHPAFWEWVRSMSRECVVLVSEYAAPDDFEVVWSKETKTDMRMKDGRTDARVERLFEMREV